MSTMKINNAPAYMVSHAEQLTVQVIMINVATNTWSERNHEKSPNKIFIKIKKFFYDACIERIWESAVKADDDVLTEPQIKPS